MISLSSGLKNNLLNSLGLRSLLAGGAIHLFDGSQPSNADREYSSNRLGVITNEGMIESFPINGLYFQNPSSGILMKSLTQTWTIRLLQPGTATWFRFVSWKNEYSGYSTNAIRLDGAIGEDLVLINPVLAAEDLPRNINSFYIHL